MASLSSDELPSELSHICLARLGLPFLLFDADETLVYANHAARRTISCLGQSSPRSSTGDPPYPPASADTRPDSLDTGGRSEILPNGDSSRISVQPQTRPTRASSQIFAFAAFDELEVSTSGLKRDRRSRKPFSLVTLLAEHAANGASSSQSPSQPEEGAVSIGPSRSAAQDAATYSCPDHGETNECQPFLQLLQDDLNHPDFQQSGPPDAEEGGAPSNWWQSSVTSVTTGQKSSLYYTVLLIAPARYKRHVRIALPEEKSHTDNLSRPPLARTRSDPPVVVGRKLSDLTEAVAQPDNPPELIPAFYKSAIENMPQILFTSARDGIVTYLNPQWYTYTGWPLSGGTPELWAQVFHPEDVDIAVHQYGSAVREGRDIRLQYRVRRSDGDFRWMIARGTCIRDPETSKVTGFVCTLTDGQELINARQEAIQAKQYMSTILKASAIALVGVDMSGTIEIFEGTVPALMSEGIASENVVGRNFDEVWPHRECADQVMRLIKTARESPNSVSEREFCVVAGRCHFRYRLSVSYDTAGSIGDTLKIQGIAIVCTDTTAMVEAEAKLVQSQKERDALAASEEAAREASRLKTVFVTSLSHEIRTPISGMIGISELLLADPSLPDQQRSLVSKQLQAGEMLLHLVSMVLDIGKMEANKLEIEERPFYLSELLSSLDILSSPAEAKGIYFVRTVSAKYDGLLLGDRLRLAQILTNFISNAIKFTSHGGVTLTVTQEEIQDGFLLRFEIVDTGVGIDAAALPQLFKPFHQANVSIARQYGGSGLGLTIAKSLTELMNGTISLESTLGVGTTVKLGIPVARATIQPPPTVDELMAKETLERDQTRILIVEDNNLLQQVYSALVRRMGFVDITVADDGQEALDRIQAQDFDLVLMDVELPRLTGPEAVKIIRSNPEPRIRNLKIIALTANAMSGDEARFLAIGMDMYLSKPVRASTLEHAIVTCLRRPPAAVSIERIS